MALRPFFVIGIPVLVLVLSILLSGLKSKTQLGRQGSKDVYTPTECPDSGFVGGANRLLAKLLLDTLNADIPVTNLDSLNKKYLALEFALPYDEDHKATIEASDLRLVGIRAERIKDDRDRMFYYNSRFPKLLEMQKEQIADTYFRISSKGERYNRKEQVKPIKVTKVEVIPSMFKVALTKDPWTGIIEGAQNCLFDESNAVFLNYGNTILPLPKVKKADLVHPIRLDAIADESLLLNANGSNIDYYNLYNTMMFGKGDGKSSCVNINLNKSTRDEHTKSPEFTLCYAHDSLFLRLDVDRMRIYGKKKTYIFHKKSQGEQDDAIVPAEDGMKIIAEAGDGRKIAEFTLFTHDPTRKLSSLSLTNVGRERINIPAGQTDLFTRQMIRGLSRNMSNIYNIDTVTLSIDPLFSKLFEDELKSYLHAVKKTIGTPKHIKKGSEQYDISMTVMDMATGDIIATPYYTTRLDEIPEKLRMTTRNPALSRRFIGSTFKPMVALASVLTNPNLINLDTHGKYHLNGDDKTATFLGRNTEMWARKSSSHWYGSTFTDFLSYSDDVYPVALAAIAMSDKNLENGTTLSIRGDNNYFKMQKGLLHFRNADEVNFGPQSHPFNDWLTYLFAANYDSDINTDTIFKNLYTKNNLSHQERRYGLDELIPDVTNLYLNRFLEGNGFRQMLPPWVLGQGDNQWSCIKVAEAWSRMLTKRNVLASFIHNDKIPSSLVDGVEREPQKHTINGPATKTGTNNTWNAFLNHLHEAQYYQSAHNNTLGRMYNQVNTLNKSGIKHSLVLFSKTGTPDIYDRYDVPLIGGNRRQIDLGMYTFGLMDDKQYQNVKDNKPARGIVCVVRITRTYECTACSDRQRRHLGQCSRCEAFNGVNSFHARNFFSENSSRMRKFYDLTRKYY